MGRIGLEHDPEKWGPVFRKDHAQIKEIEGDDVSKKYHPALAFSERGPAFRMCSEADRVAARKRVNTRE
jgi:hypothetical protein